MDFVWPETCRKIYCISIRDERLKKFKQRLGPELAKFVVRDDIGVKGNEVQEKYFHTKVNQTVKTKNNGKAGKKLTPGQVGCAKSHFACWQT